MRLRSKILNMTISGGLALTFSVYSIAQTQSGKSTESVSDPKIRIIGLAKNGSLQTYSIPEKLFKYSIGRSLQNLHKKAMGELLQYQTFVKELELSRVTVGLKIESEFGLGKWTSLGLETAFDLRYEPLPKPKSITNTVSLR